MSGTTIPTLLQRITRRRVKALSWDAPVTRESRVILAERDGNTVLMDLRGGSYYGCNAVGSRIWSSADGEHTPRQIVQEIAAEYDAPVPQIASDVHAFLSTMLENRLVLQ